MTAARKIATYQDVLAAPLRKVAEVVGGNLSLHPRPAPRHARATTALASELRPFDAGPIGGWVLLIEPEVHFGSDSPDIMVPDVAGWRLERMPELPQEAYFSVVPDWVCEVLSPTTARFDRQEKLPAYFEHGVSYLWLVDPLYRTVEAFERGATQWAQRGVWSDEDCVRIAPFEKATLDLAMLWRGTRKVSG